MKHLKTAYVKLYYKYGRLALPQADCTLPPGLSDRRCIFLYFDYEREFGGHQTGIRDEDVTRITDILAEGSIRATWFTVGKIFEEYPDSVSRLISHGHEIGSHSYGHVAPLLTTNTRLRRDFEKFRDVSGGINGISGFHAPNGLWSLKMIERLSEFGFRYDLVRRKADFLSASKIKDPYKSGEYLVRLYSAGDDWALYKTELSARDPYTFFTELLDTVKTGMLRGIGFHPWVLVSDRKILEGFRLFIQHISGMKGLCHKTAGDYATELLKES